MDYKKINDHMQNKFSGQDKVIHLKNTPSIERIRKLNDNQIIKAPILAIAVDLVDYKKLSEYSNAKKLNQVMSEYIWGVTKIMKEFHVIQIDIQGDGIYGIMPSAAYKKDMDSIFSLACYLNTFQNHMKQNIDKFYSNDEITASYYKSGNPSDHFNFGIGMWLSDDNYITKSGHGSTRNIIFIGEAVNYANKFAKIANRNGSKSICMNDYLYNNFTDKKSNRIADIGGFESSYSRKSDVTLWFCDWIIIGYNNFVNNNL